MQKIHAKTQRKKRRKEGNDAGEVHFLPLSFLRELYALTVKFSQQAESCAQEIKRGEEKTAL